MLRFILSILMLFMLSTLLFACEIKEEESNIYNQLDRLRVLAIRAEPPDLAPSESAELSALIFEPEDREVSYEWSWCPVRNDGTEGFTCALREKELRAIWDKLDTEVELPPYDLGTEQTAIFDNVFTPELINGVCSALLTDDDANEVAILACLGDLEISIQLIVETDEAEVTAIKGIPLLKDEVDEDERNTNPDPTGDIVVKHFDDASELDDDAPLQTGKTYMLRAEFASGTECSDEDDPEDCQAETYLPKKLAGLDDPEPRKETLVMTWFVTMGTTLVENEMRWVEEDKREEDDDEIRGVDHTTFVDGQELDELTQNLWEIPFETDKDQAQLFLVLRDERGGVGWTEHRFQVEGDER